MNFKKMANKKSIENQSRILKYLFRKGSVCNTYQIARELEMEKEEVLEGLQELAKESKVKLLHGSVVAVTEKISRRDALKNMSEVEELKKRVDKLEKAITFTFGQLIESIKMGYRKTSSKKQSEEDASDHPERKS